MDCSNILFLYLYVLTPASFSLNYQFTCAREFALMNRMLQLHTIPFHISSIFIGLLCMCEQATVPPDAESSRYDTQCPRIGLYIHEMGCNNEHHSIQH